ncbi:MAG: GAF domain-containing protein [Endomicrobiales bacterium]
MNRLIIKFSVFLVSVLVLLCVVAGSSAYFWMNAQMKGYLAGTCEPAAAALAEMVAVRPNRQQIKNVLTKLSRNTDIVMSAVANEKGEILYARGVQKREEVIWPLYVSYPLLSDGKTLGRLKVWPAPETVYREMTHVKNRAAALSYLAALLVLVFAAGYLYFRLHLSRPLGRLREFIGHVERDEETTLDIGSGHAEWRTLGQQLNKLNDKIFDTSSTLQMLFSVSQTLTSHIDVNEVFNVILDFVQKKFPGVRCSVILMGEDGFLRHKSQRGYSPDFYRGIHLRPGEGYAGKAYQKCQTVVVNDADGMEGLTKPMIEKEGLQSFVHVPLVTESKCAGLLNVSSREKDFFTPERINTLSTLAKYLSIGLRNAQLYERVQELNRHLETEVSITTRELLQTNSRLIHKVREMKALSDIAAFAAAKANLAEILELTVEKMKELLNAQAAGFFLYSPETGEMVPQMPFFGIKDHDFTRLRFRLEDVTVLSSALTEGKTYQFNDPPQAAAAVPLLGSLLEIHSLVLVPLRSGKKNIGILGIANKFGAPFDKDDQRIAELIADRISGMIENVRLYQELESRLHDLTVLQGISSAISSEPVWEKTLSKVISATTQAFGADLCALLFYDEKNNELVTQPGAYFTGGDEAILLRIPVNDPNSLSAQVFRSGEPFLSMDASIDPGIRSQTARLWDVRSLILVPLKAENRVIGVLRIGKHQANCYNKEHLRLATLIAHQSAIIIENAHLYDSLRDAKAELEQLNQMKNEFISMVSHELRTPLTAVKGFVKVVLEGETGELNEQQAKFLQIADQSIDRLTILISDLLDISRIEAGQLRLRLLPLDSKEVVSLVIRNMKPEAGKRNLKLNAHFPGKFPLVMADRERLTQVFDNLVLNSIKFTPEGGRVTLSAVDKGDFVVFSVSDTGIGIDKKDQQKIFEKFFQVDSGPTRSSAGTGLGLAIVKSIVEMHGGQIWVESELGKGADFQFIIPRAKTEIKDFRRETGPREQPAQEQQ